MHFPEDSRKNVLLLIQSFKNLSMLISKKVIQFKWQGAKIIFRCYITGPQHKTELERAISLHNRQGTSRGNCKESQQMIP